MSYGIELVIIIGGVFVGEVLYLGDESIFEVFIYVVYYNEVFGSYVGFVVVVYLFYYIGFYGGIEVCI